MADAVSTPVSPWLQPMEDAWADPGSPPPPPPGGSGDDQAPPNLYANVGEWVEKWLSETYRRPVTTNQLWCAWWFHHPEAVSRLVGAWRAWEQLSRPAQWGGDEWFGISIWWNVHGDPCMDRLMSLNGPFHDCTGGKCSAGPDGSLPVGPEPLPSASIPDGLFDP